LLPAVRASFLDPYPALKGTRSSAGRTERRLLGGVATFQIALTLALLAGAVLLIRTMSNLTKVRPGYDTENILAMTVTSVQREQWKDFHTRALERVSALPGVRQAAFVWGLPLTGNKWRGQMEIVGQPESSKLKEQMHLPLRTVTPDYFDALGIKIVDGRGFRPSDNSEAPAVAVVNEALAGRYFPKTNPIGRKMRFVGDTNRVIEVVGIVSNTRTEALSHPAEPEIYFPFWQSSAFSKDLIVRAASDPRPLAAVVKRELQSVDPTAAVEHVRTMEDIRRESVAPRTFAMRLLVGFSLAASALALVGIYGVVSLSVGARTKEIAVRMAIGAQWHEILRLILGEGFRLIVLGVFLGAIIAVSLGRVLEAFLFETKPADPVTLGGVALLFAAVALVACLLPACRAARVDPMEALRYE
jgi:predicted permease